MKINEIQEGSDREYLNLPKEDIENIIINKRKLALKKELHETIYEEALKTKKFEVYRN